MPFEKEIRAAAEKYQIPYPLLYAQVRRESSFNPSAVSKCGAMGLLQLMPRTGVEMGLKPDEFFDPAKNLTAGARYLKRMYKNAKGMVLTLPKVYRDKPVEKKCTEEDFWKMALAAYNGGLGYVIKAINICMVDGHPIAWEYISGELSDKREVVRGRDPDEKQIRDYVARIWAEYEKAEEVLNGH